MSGLGWRVGLKDVVRGRVEANEVLHSSYRVKQPRFFTPLISSGLRSNRLAWQAKCSTWLVEEFA